MKTKTISVGKKVGVWFLCLALLVTLIPATAQTVSATVDQSVVSDITLHTDNSVNTLKVSFHYPSGYGVCYKTPIVTTTYIGNNSSTLESTYKSQTSLDASLALAFGNNYSYVYKTSSSSIPTGSPDDSSPKQVGDWYLTLTGQTNTLTLTFGQGKLPVNNTNTARYYYVYSWTTFTFSGDSVQSYYPDGLFAVLKTQNGRFYYVSGASYNDSNKDSGMTQIKLDNPGTLKTPTLTATKDSIVLTNVNEDQVYSIDGGATWVTGTSLKQSDGTYAFTSLTPGTSYTVQTKLPETDDYKASDTVSQTVSTLVTVSGTVTGEDLPATVVITDKSDSTKKYTVTTDDNGNYSIDVAPGSYSVSVTGKDGLQAGTIETLTVASGSNTLTGNNVTMSNTPKGDAKDFADDHLVNPNTTQYFSSLDELDYTETIDQVLNSYSDYQKLSDDAKKALDTMLSPTTYNKLYTWAGVQDETLDEIDKLDDMNLTTEDAKSLNAEMQTARSAAKTAINAATSDTEIATAKKTYDEALSLIDKKATALDEINEELSDEKAKIDALENLSDAEKDAFKKEIDAAVTAAKKAIEEATTEDAVTAAKEAYDESVALIIEKAKGTDSINEEAQDAKDAVNELENLTDDEKAQKIKEIEIAADSAKTAVSKATDKAGIAAAVAGLIEDLNLILSKADALDKINAKSKDAADAVNALEYLTDAEKQEKIDEINTAVETAKNAVDSAKNDSEITEAVETLESSLKDITDKAAAEDLIAGYLEDENDDIYSPIDSTNIDSILAARDAYDNLSDDQRALVDEILKDRTNGEYESYADFEKAAEEAVQKGATSFIAKHMTKSGKVITKASKDNYANILGGKDDWNKLSQAEKDAINAQLKAAGATQTYEEMLASVEKAVEKSANSFIKKYVSDNNGNIYLKATRANYAQILSGLDAWNALTQSEKDAINAKLLAAGGMTYEDLIAQAKEIKAQIEAEKAKAAKTGDDMNLPICAGLMLISLMGMGLGAATRRRNDG